MPLSVLSALSRLGLDPRDEAARLAHLTKEAAADQLARMIARLYERRWSDNGGAEGSRAGSSSACQWPAPPGRPIAPLPGTRLTTGFGGVVIL